jgi:hypothetical protein
MLAALFVRAASAQHHAAPEHWEAEFVASNVFRSGSYLQPLWKGLGFEGHYFGGEFSDVFSAGASWTFRLGEWKLSPGAAVVAGTGGTTTTPAVTFRWDYERDWFVTQGLAVQGFRRSNFAEGEGEQPRSVRPIISDGNHASARWKRLTIGGSWEHIDFREGNEWKGGGRVAVRLWPRVSAVVYVLAPKTEFRGGLLFHPPHESHRP